MSGSAGAARASLPQAASLGGPCSKLTAQKLNPDTVLSVVCGAFLGPGSQAMVANLTNGTCLPSFSWNLYVLKGGSWQEVQLGAHGGFTGYPVVAVGNELKETLMVPKPGQPVCLATATRSRIWHWNGSSLVPGAWTGAKGGSSATTPASAKREHYYTSPTGNIICAIAAANVSCQTYEPPQRAVLYPTGKLDLCRAASCPGNPGEGALFTKIPYGRSVSAGPFRCTSAFTGVTCVVTATGKGFSIARQGLKKVA